MKRLSKEAERKVLEALEEAVRLTDGGMGPNEALCKAAGDAQLGPGHARLMAYAYNTGKTNSHRKKAAGVLEAAEEFPLADPEAVVRLMYPADVKTASVVVPPRRSAPSEYATAPYWAERLAGARQRASVSREPVVLTKAAAPRLPDATPPARPAAPDRAVIKRAAEEARLGVHRVHERMRSVATALGEYFLTDARAEPFADFRKNAELKHGRERVAPLLDHVQEAHPFLLKRAGTETLRPATGRPYELLERALRLEDDYRKARTAFAKAAADEGAAAAAVRPQRARAKRANALRPGGMEDVAETAEGPGAPAATASVLRKRAGLFSGAGSVVSGLSALDTAKDIAGKVRLGGKPTDRRLDDTIAKLNDPAHDAELQNIHAEAMLADLLNNDEVISGYAPGEVVRLYNDISNIAPRLANRPMAMRTLLRKHLAQGGQVDPYEIDMIAGIENRIKQYEEPSLAAMQNSLVPQSVLKAPRR